MARKYHFNMERYGHDIDHALVMLRNRLYDAEQAGDAEAAGRIQDRLWRLSMAAYAFSGLIQVTWEEWKLLDAARRWAQETRMARCMAAGIDYVD